MGIAQPADDNRDARRLFRRGHVPYLVRGAAERTQQIDLGTIRARKRGAAAHGHHLGATTFTLAGVARNMEKVARAARVGDI